MRNIMHRLGKAISVSILAMVLFTLLYIGRYPIGLPLLYIDLIGLGFGIFLYFVLDELIKAWC